MGAPSYTTPVANYDSDPNSLAFIQAQAVGIYVTGLKPSTQVHVFFDQQLVDNYIRRATLTNFTNTTVDDFNPISAMGSGSYFSDVNGNFCAIFYLPAATFFTGSRQILVTDVSAYTELDSSTTSATVTFNAFNFAFNSADTTIVATLPPQSSITTSTSARDDTATPDSSIFNPIYQTFYIGSDTSGGEDGVFVPQAELYFASADPNNGVTIDIKTVQNGIPTTTSVPGAKLHLDYAQINVSNTGSLKTIITFPQPVFLRTGYEYALCIIPDSASPLYSIYTAVVGGTDLNSGQVITKNWGDGTLYTSTNGLDWVPIQNEYMRFVLYRCRFDNLDLGPETVTLVNKSYEFLSLANVSSAFQSGEYVFQTTSNSTGTVTFSSSNSTLSGHGTSFHNILAANSKIAVSNGAAWDVLTVNTVVSNTSLVLNGFPRFSASNVGFQVVVCGKVSKYDPQKAELTLTRSNAANSGFLFQANSNLTGALSNSTAQLVTIVDKPIARFQPLLHTTSVHDTSIDFSALILNSDYSNSGFTEFNQSSINYIANREAIVSSKSNEILYNSGKKSITANVVISTSSEYVSPVLDLTNMTLLTYMNYINNSDYKEYENLGQAQARYITDTINLAQGLDSENIQVYLTGYRPLGTDIEVYAKILNGTDPSLFSTKDWTKLVIDQPNTYSDSSNRNDTIEYTYTFTDNPISTRLPGILTTNTANSIVVGTGASFISFLSNNNIIKLFANSSNANFEVHKVLNNVITLQGQITCNTTSNTVTGTNTIFTSQVSVNDSIYTISDTLVGQVSAVTNSSSLTLYSNAAIVTTNTGYFGDARIQLDNAPTFSSNIAVYDKLAIPHSAFLNNLNNGIVRYYDTNGVAYDTYISYALKVVLLSNTSYLVPRALNLRALAVSV